MSGWYHSHMDMDTPAAPASSAPAAPRAPAPRRHGLALLLSSLALLGAGYAVWRAIAFERVSGGIEANAAATRAELEALNRRIDQSNRDRDALRQRLDDAAGVNKALREEVLGVSERARVLEDAVANLAEKRLSGHDGVLLDEAELLLMLGQDRYALFRDTAAAAMAFRHADAALAAVNDPAFTGVRETVAVEAKALETQPLPAASGGIAELERLRAQLDVLALARDASVPATEDDSRLWRVLGRFVRISHDTATPLGTRDRGMARMLITLDLRNAEAALLARDMESYRAALQRARGAFAATFDAQAEATRSALATLDRLGNIAPPPAPIELGAALKELRNLRATHSLGRNATHDFEQKAGAQ